jgi:hypothetical protein
MHASRPWAAALATWPPSRAITACLTFCQWLEDRLAAACRRCAFASCSARWLWLSGTSLPQLPQIFQRGITATCVTGRRRARGPVREARVSLRGASRPHGSAAAHALAVAARAAGLPRDDQDSQAWPAANSSPSRQQRRSTRHRIAGSKDRAFQRRLLALAQRSPELGVLRFELLDLFVALPQLPPLVAVGARGSRRSPSNSPTAHPPTSSGRHTVNSGARRPAAAEPRDQRSRP